MQQIVRARIAIIQANIFLMMAWFLPWGRLIGVNWGMSIRAGFTVAYGIWWIGGMVMAETAD